MQYRDRRALPNTRRFRPEGAASCAAVSAAECRVRSKAAARPLPLRLRLGPFAAHSGLPMCAPSVSAAARTAVANVWNCLNCFAVA